MSLLFDALQRAQDSDNEPGQGDGQFGPAVGIQPAVNRERTPPNLEMEIGMPAAQAIFAASARQPRRVILLAAGGLALLLLAGGGGFWYYQRPVASPTTNLAATHVPAKAQTPKAPGVADLTRLSVKTTPAAMPPAPPTPLANGTAQGTLAEGVEAITKGSDDNAGRDRAEGVSLAPNTAASLAPIMAKSAREQDAPIPKNPSQPRRAPPAAQQHEQPEKDIPPPPAVADPSAESHIRLDLSVDPLHEGYKALAEGRMDDAERLYQEVVAKRPHERDALLGLAVIAHRGGQTERASDLYRQVLQEDPDNATATAALVNLSALADPVAAGSRLKQLLDQNPSAAELHHALGRVFALQKRWGEAQQAFFQAYSLKPDNAHYAYNLAVALDRLHQSAAALPYYEQSVQILKPGDIAMDRDTIQRRVRELRGTLPEQR